jgi:hypothetical protein
MTLLTSGTLRFINRNGETTSHSATSVYDFALHHSIWVGDELQDRSCSLARQLNTLSFTGHTFTDPFSSHSTLFVGINIGSPATAVTANNLFGYFVGAGALAAAVSLIERIGMGWTCTLVASISWDSVPCFGLCLNGAINGKKRRALRMNKWLRWACKLRVMKRKNKRRRIKNQATDTLC